MRAPGPGLERAALVLSVAAALAAAAPTAALNELTATPLLSPGGVGGGGGTSAGVSVLAGLTGAPGPSVGLAMFERSVLPAECAAGEYPLTLVGRCRFTLSTSR